MESGEQEGSNPFDDLFFWLNLASVDFGFFENEKNQKDTQDGNNGVRH